jgi:hypothetical protein
MKKGIEFSKLAFFVVTAINLYVIGFVLWYIATTLDGTPLEWLIPTVGTEQAAATGFYFNKAKAENKIKLMRENGVKPKREDFYNE